MILLVVIDEALLATQAALTSIGGLLNMGNSSVVYLTSPPTETEKHLPFAAAIERRDIPNLYYPSFRCGNCKSSRFVPVTGNSPCEHMLGVVMPWRRSNAREIAAAMCMDQVAADTEFNGVLSKSAQFFSPESVNNAFSAHVPLPRKVPQHIFVGIDFGEGKSNFTVAAIAPCNTGKIYVLGGAVIQFDYAAPKKCSLQVADFVARVARRYPKSKIHLGAESNTTTACALCMATLTKSVTLNRLPNVSLVPCGAHMRGTIRTTRKNKEWACQIWKTLLEMPATITVANDGSVVSVATETIYIYYTLDDMQGSLQSPQTHCADLKREFAAFKFVGKTSTPNDRVMAIFVTMFEAQAIICLHRLPGEQVRIVYDDVFDMGNPIFDWIDS